MADHVLTPPFSLLSSFSLHPLPLTLQPPSASSSPSTTASPRPSRSHLPSNSSSYTPYINFLSSSFPLFPPPINSSRFGSSSFRVPFPVCPSKRGFLPNSGLNSSPDVLLLSSSSVLSSFHHQVSSLRPLRRLAGRALTSSPPNGSSFSLSLSLPPPIFF